MSQGQLVILNGLRQISSGLASQLQQYISSGGNVLIFPSMQADMESYNTFLRSIQVNNYGARFGERREVTQINTRQEVFSDVFEKITDNIDLPFATEGFDLLAYSGAAEEPLLTFQGGLFVPKCFDGGKWKSVRLRRTIGHQKYQPPDFTPFLYRWFIKWPCWAVAAGG